MKNIYAVLQQKQAELGSLQMELRALHIVAPLLEEDRTPEEQKPVATLAARPHESEPEMALAVSAASSESKKWWQL